MLSMIVLLVLAYFASKVYLSPHMTNSHPIKTYETNYIVHSKRPKPDSDSNWCKAGGSKAGFTYWFSFNGTIY
jgi:hypothetical protein